MLLTVFWEWVYSSNYTVYTTYFKQSFKLRVSSINTWK